MTEARPIFWGAVGGLVGMAMAVGPLLSGASLSSSLRVGEESDAAPFIAEELGGVPVTRGQGHDGQYNYLIARDPLGTSGAVDLADAPAYRLRRPLLGWLAGAFGAAPPGWALIGLAVWPVVGLALAAAGLERLRHHFGAGTWVLLGVLASPGLLLSIQLRTSDTLVLAGGLWAVDLAVRDRHSGSRLAAILATLAKEVAIAFAVSLAWWELRRSGWRQGLATLALPAAVLSAWMIVVAITTGDPTSTKGNVDWPLVGMASGLEWQGVERWLGLAALASVIVGVAGAARTSSRLVRTALVPWLALAMLSSAVVWGDGNNAVRVFTPLLSLGLLAIGSSAKSRPPGGTTLPSPRDRPEGA